MSSPLGSFAGLRVGFGMEVCRMSDDAPLRLGGAEIDHPSGCEGGADPVCHAVLDALLTACGLPDVRTIFPADDPEPLTEDPLVLLSQGVTALRRKRLTEVLNLSVRIAACPKLALSEDRVRMANLLSSALQIEPGQVTISLGATDQFQEVQRGQALAVFAHVLCLLKTAEREAGKQPRAKQAILPAAEAEEEDDASLPERAQRFKQAVATKLPPLPPAPTPRAGARLVIYTDGASRGNPGPSASGWVILDEQGRLVKEGGSPLGVHTNNEAEYLAVGEVAQWIEQNLGREFELEFRLDSELVVRQLSGQWKVKDKELKQLAMRVMNTLMYFMSFELKHVPRKENQRADALANKALGEK